MRCRRATRLARHCRGDVTVHEVHVLAFAVVGLRPSDLPGRVHESDLDPESRPVSPYAAVETASPQGCRRSAARPPPLFRSANVEFRASTRTRAMRATAVMSSSLIPSASTESARSPPWLANGSTAIAGSRVRGRRRGAPRRPDSDDHESIAATAATPTDHATSGAETRVRSPPPTARGVVCPPESASTLMWSRRVRGEPRRRR